MQQDLVRLIPSPDLTQSFVSIETKLSRAKLCKICMFEEICRWILKTLWKCNIWKVFATDNPEESLHGRNKRNRQIFDWCSGCRYPFLYHITVNCKLQKLKENKKEKRNEKT